MVVVPARYLVGERRDSIVIFRGFTTEPLNGARARGAQARSSHRRALPAVIVHSASEDYNFTTGMLAAKFAARLQRANRSSKPVLWVPTAGGHRPLFGVSPQ